MQLILLATLALALLLLLLSRRWKRIRQKGKLFHTLGLIALCSAKLRSLLLERSILDIFRDVVYFPYITKIISAYLRIAATKPHP